MKTAVSRLTTLFIATIMTGVVLTMLAPSISHAIADAQPTPSGTRNTHVRLSVARATRALQRGDTLKSDDFVLVDTTITWRWSSVSPDTTRPQTGWIARRAIVAGEVLRAPAVAPAPVIAAGARVNVLWQDGSLRLVLKGIATNAAALGAAVGVRIDRNRRLDGIAVAPNTVRLR